MMRLKDKSIYKVLADRSSRGFTIVELLIVVVVIAILAAITIVSYNGITSQAYDSSVKNDLTVTAKKIILYEQEEGAWPYGSYLDALNIKLNKTAYSRGYNNGASWFNFVYCWPNVNTDSSRFALVAQSKSGKTFAWVNGTVTEVAPLVGSVASCSAVGSPIVDGNARDWLYENDAWRTTVK